MATEWKKVRLDEMGTISRGRSKHRPRNDPSLFDGKYPFIQTADVKNTNLYISEYSQTYNEKGLSQSKLWQPGTLCITIAANIADTGILSIPACFPDSVMGFIPFKEVSDARYVKYCFDILQRECKAISVGAAQDNLSWDKLSRIQFPCPPLETQQKIAGILSAYDDLIENNRKQIKLLEEAAQKLYKEWFVKLNFPGHENVKIVDGVPEGWKKGMLSDIAIDAGKPVNKKDRNIYTYYLPIDCLPKKSLSYISYNSVELAESSLCSFKEGDVVFGAMRPYFHKVVIARDSGLTRNTCFVINSTSVELYAYLVLLLFSVDTINYATKVSVGTTMPYVRWNDFIKMQVLIPDNKSLITFSKITLPYFEKMNKLADQIQLLQSARDKFLPRLMSEEFEV